MAMPLGTRSNCALKSLDSPCGIGETFISRSGKYVMYYVTSEGQ